MASTTNTHPSDLQDLQLGINKNGDSKLPSYKPPAWYDEEKFIRGQDFFRRHVAAIGLSMHCSLVSGFSIINLLEPLVFTNESNTPEKAFRRYVLTFYHIFMWMTGDLFDHSSRAHRSIVTVRGMHRNVAKRMALARKDKVKGVKNLCRL